MFDSNLFGLVWVRFVNNIDCTGMGHLQDGVKYLSPYTFVSPL